MRILFLSTLNFATNPRLTKEVRLALEKGNQVEVICFEFNNWSFANNLQIKEEFREAALHCIPAGRKPFFPWAISAILEASFRTIGKWIPLNGWMRSQAVSRRTILLMQKIKSLKGKYDLIIGHNPGALYPTWFAGKKFEAKTGFDVEDYHPGETNNPIASHRIRLLLKTFLPKMDYLTFASMPIRMEVKKLAGVDGPIILNWFSASEFGEVKTNTGKLKLVWFSQNISFYRGLEIVIPIVEGLNDVELHLFGNRNESFERTWINGRKNIIIHSPIPQIELHKKLSEFDIGLAIEPGKDRNNELAVSNKVLAYLQTGLFILATDTPAQKHLLSEFRGNGVIVKLEKQKLFEIIQDFAESKQYIRDFRSWRAANCKYKNWESESKKLLEIWQQIGGG